MAKDKNVAVILAVFFGPWSWLYTAKKDIWKFVVGLIVGFLGMFFLFLPGIMIHIWAIVDQAIKTKKEYKKL